jgi:hypothetical protein
MAGRPKICFWKGAIYTIFLTLSDQLKTYGTRGEENFDLESLKVMAGIISGYDTVKHSSKEINSQDNSNDTSLK